MADVAEAAAPSERVVQRFRELTGEESGGVWSAPGRANLIGEHTDYNEGHVLPFAVAARTFAALRLRSDGIVRVASLQRDGVASSMLADLPRSSGWAAYVFGTVWALREAGVEVRGLDVVVDGQVPPGAGLSSSAALECAVALGVTELVGSTLSRLELAAAGQRAENDVVGAPVGLMDQAASMLARAGAALLLDCRSLEWEHVPLDPTSAGLRLLLVDTRVSHDLADGQYAERRRACEQVAHLLGVGSLRDVSLAQLTDSAALDQVLLRRARHVVTEQRRVGEAVTALRAGDWPLVGRLLSESHASLRDDYEVSVPELDGAVEAAVDAGALGARLTGGGFGGNVLALVPEAAVDDVRTAVGHRAAREGWPEPHCLLVDPGAGARRER